MDAAEKAESQDEAEDDEDGENEDEDLCCFAHVTHNYCGSLNLL